MSKIKLLSKTREKRNKKSGKEKYRTPELTLYGDFRKLTAAKAGSRADGSGKPKTRTQNGQSS